MIHWTDERHFIVGALWATIGIMVMVVITQLLRDYTSGFVRLLGILVLVAWIFFWFSSGKTIKIVYHFIEVLSKRTEERRCQK